MSAPEVPNPYRPSTDGPTRPSVRIGRWTVMLCLLGVFAYGLVSWCVDSWEYRTLLLSDAALVEQGRLVDVEVRSTAKSRTTTTTAVAGGREYTQQGLSEWADREGEEVLVTTHPDTDLWLMSTLDGTLTTEGTARNGGVIYMILSSVPLGLVAAAAVHRRVMAPRWDRERARLAALEAAQPHAASRSEQRRRGTLSGSADHPG